MYRHILLPTDGSELSQNAVDYGMALAKSVNAKVTVLTVSTPFHVFAVEPHAELPAGQDLVDHAFEFERFFLGHAAPLKRDV